VQAAGNILSIASSTITGTNALLSIGTSTTGGILSVLANGNVGIGTTTPDQTLSLNSANSSIGLRDSVTGAMGWVTRFTNRVAISSTNELNLYGGATSNASGNGLVIQADGISRPSTDNSYSLGTSGFRFTTVFATNGTINTSDARMKQNVLDLSATSSLDKIMALRPVTYQWIATSTDGGRTHLGFLAQEVQQVVPEAVYGEASTTFGVNYSEFIPLLTKGIQELNGKIFGSKATQAISIEEITASSTISVDDKLKALGTNMGEVNKFLKDLKEVNATSSLGTTTTNTVVNTTTSQVACDANQTVGASLNGGIITSIATSSSGVSVNGQEGINYSCTVTVTSTTTTTTTDLTFVGKIIERIKTWLADAQNGIVEVFVGKVNTKELCVGDGINKPRTCLTQDQIDNLLNSAVNNINNSNNNSGNQNPPAPSPQPTPNSTPDPAPQPNPEPQPDSNINSTQNTGETTP
jgi:hypothetical protein